MLRIVTLGGLRVAMGDRPLDWVHSQRRRSALLVYIAVEGQVPRERVAGIFWPDSPPDRARRALNQAVYDLRRRIGEDRIVITGDTIAPGSGVWVDVHAFEEACRNERDTEALALYGGAFLDGANLMPSAEFEHWAERRRTALQRQHRQVRRKRVAQLVEAGEMAEALAVARGWVGVDPLEDEAQHRLIELLAANGERTEALQQYDTYLRLLRGQELSPLDETQALVASLRSGESGRVAGPVVALDVALAGAPLAVPAPDEGIRGGPEPVPGRVSRGARARPWLRRAGWVAGFVLLAALARVLMDTAAPPPVGNEWNGAAAPAIAVLPFTVSGPDTEEWSEGMVRLLSTGLDGAGGMRAIDSRAVLAQWDRFATAGTPPGPGLALEVAAAAGARYALIGSVIAIGPEIRLVAELYGLDGRERTRRVQVEGLRAEILSLVDQLAVGVLRLLLGNRDAADLPRIDVANITTDSLSALRAFFEGEEHWRRSRFSEASVAYSRAVEIDSAFGFAWFRLYQACWWGGVACGDNDASYYTEQGLRHADRLPQRQRELLEATLHSFDSVAVTIGRLQRFTQRYPEDAEGWYLLGDLSYHPHLAGWPYTPSQVALAAFRRAIELDPWFGPAYEHLVPDAFAAGDTAEAARLIDLLRRIDPATDHVTGLGLAFDLAFGAPAARATARAALATASTEVLQHSYFHGDANCCASLPERWEQDLLVARALTANRHPATARRAAAVELALIYTSRGRFREADSIYAAIPPESAAQRKTLVILTNQVGVTAESSMVHRAVKALGDAAPLYRHYSGAARALREGRRSEADAEIRALESIGRLTSGALSAGLRALQAADTDSTIRSFERALGFAAGPIVFQLRYDLGRLSLESGDLERAEEHLASIEMREAHGLNAPIEYYLGKVYERLGNSERARLHYGRFVVWWQDCDPEVRPMWEEARQAVARLQ